MLFDLRGRRRRAVQATYLMLAVLMGGGLVLFGIGGDVSGGLVDAFKGGGGGSADEVVDKRIEDQEKRLSANPQNPALLQSLLRDYYQLATAQQAATGGFSEDARDELRKAGSYWQRYVETTDGEPDPDSARYALQIYDVAALNQPKEAQAAASIIARTQNDAAAYLQLIAYAALAGDTRTADLAAKKAVDLAPKGERKAVKEQAELLKTPPRQQQAGG